MNEQKAKACKNFFRFLKEMGVYKQFIKYTDFENGFHCAKNLIHYLSITPKTDFIVGAFPWSSAPQGTSFWAILNDWWSHGKIPDNFREELIKLDNSKKQ